MPDVLQFDGRAACTGAGETQVNCAGGTLLDGSRRPTARSFHFHVVPAPAFEHCSSWSPVAPLTPTAPVTLPSTMIGTPPGEANTPGSVAVAGPPLLIASMKTRVVRR